MLYQPAALLACVVGTALAAPAAAPSSTEAARPEIDINSAIPKIVPVNTRGGDAELISKLLSVSTNADRAALLDQPGDFVFDFSYEAAPKAALSKGKGGATISANAKTFPALIGTGSAMTVGELGPCGFNTPHVHNRATELNIIVHGRLVTNFVTENRVEPVENTMEQWQMSVFPQGAIHGEYNPDCSPAVFVAGFNSEDPGVSQIAQNFFALEDQLLKATLGGVNTFNGEDIETFRNVIPANVALGIDRCLERCGIQRNAKRDISDFMSLVE
ncbi:cupin domain-containing protein [Sarocladium implicatum]|nr:cupin domain-containing protein [Sarocladium implicatum]